MEFETYGEVVLLSSHKEINVCLKYQELKSAFLFLSAGSSSLVH